MSARAHPEDFCVVLADADQLTMFSPPIEVIRPMLQTRPSEGG